MNNVHRKLSEKDKQDLENNLTLKDLKEALDDTENEKSPGCDGIPYEFYKHFWPLLGNDLLAAVMYSLNHKHALSVSQRTSVITLLFKGDYRNCLKTGAPSLCCVQITKF